MPEKYEEMNELHAKAIKAALLRHHLTQRWLLHRLDRDWGIKVSYVVLSDVLEGKRPIGRKMQRMLWCAGQIIKEYEEFYKEKGG